MDAFHYFKGISFCMQIDLSSNSAPIELAAIEN